MTEIIILLQRIAEALEDIADSLAYENDKEFEDLGYNPYQE